MCYNMTTFDNNNFMKTALLLSLLLSSISFANQNSTFANALNAQAQKTEQAQPIIQTPQKKEQPTTEKAKNQTTTEPTETLLENIAPSDSELSKANTELLTKNAELTRQVDDLTTQVNVLVQERSGQLFVYGAITALVSVIIGFILAKLLTKQRW